MKSLGFDQRTYCCLLMAILFTFNLEVSVAKSNKFDGGIVNLLKIHFERLLVKILRVQQLQEERELMRLKQLLVYYYKYNETVNISEVHQFTPMEDFEVFTGTPPDLSITQIDKFLRHNRAYKYKTFWKLRRKNHSAGCRDYLKSCLRKLPHVNRTLAEIVLDEIRPVTRPTNPYFERFKSTRPTKKKLLTRPPRHHLRYVSYQSIPPQIIWSVTTTHRCELC
uniref:Uncharacterized protein n=1 Tax=Cacopsylla melanoneura TaxID=428564 RepID=A0A8D9AUQ3_9HEMI